MPMSRTAAPVVCCLRVLCHNHIQPPETSAASAAGFARCLSTSCLPGPAESLRLAGGPPSSPSSPSSSSSTGDPSDRPELHHLEHIQKRLEYTVPLMFRQRLDFTFYRRDVLVEDHIFNLRKEGLPQLMSHLGYISVLGQYSFPYIRMEPLSITPIMEDGTVRLRWRVVYMTWGQALSPKHLIKNFDVAYREQRARWFDGYSIFYVDGEGLVHRFTIQKLMPDDEQARTVKKVAGVFAGTSPTATA